MPEPISLVLFSGYAALSILARQNSGVSEDAKHVACVAKQVTNNVERSMSLFGATNNALSEFLSTINENKEAGDCDPADESIERALAFIHALGDELPFPEFSIDPDGEISLDWIASKHQMLSLSIGPSDRVALAWVDGINHGHAVEIFNGREVAPRIQHHIKSLYPEYVAKRTF